MVIDATIDSSHSRTLNDYFDDCEVAVSHLSESVRIESKCGY